MTAALVEPRALQARIDDFRICDIRWSLTRPGEGRSIYREGHIPGAVYVDLDQDLAARGGFGRHPLPTVSEFASTLGRLGIGTHDAVVVYDDVGGTVAARMWWMLRSIGHEDVSLLDGGYQAWVAAGLPTETVDVEPPATRYEPRSDFTGVVRHDELEGRTIVDVRAHERYTGEYEPIDPKAGHIPGAINIPIAESLTDDGRFADRAALTAKFGSLGPDSVIACGSGVNACHTAAAMTHAGMEMPAIYIGSFSDWSQRDLPVTVGDTP